jgi:hypothetical protein
MCCYVVHDCCDFLHCHIIVPFLVVLITLGWTNISQTRVARVAGVCYVGVISPVEQYSNDFQGMLHEQLSLKSVAKAKQSLSLQVQEMHPP